MDGNTVVWIVLAVVLVLIVLAVVALLARNRRTAHRRLEAERLREQMDRRAREVQQREHIAAETDARARAAQAEAEAKAAEAARLQGVARTHQEAVGSSREDLQAQQERLAELDPETQQRR
ncbi:hypothetical protein [uncultured Mycolicibacterium sp.]|uniref:hypothetical protein n=1 Tax=uncultured Mycolicibacterium sp. TaxID=2320817 RepID=UPI00260B21A5|nr:hypothetical protein [uncultured Mycolicibacterium sp.]